MKRYSNPRGTALFILIAVFFMTVSHLVFDDGLRSLRAVGNSVVVDEAVDAADAPHPKTLLGDQADLALPRSEIPADDYLYARIYDDGVGASRSDLDAWEHQHAHDDESVAVSPKEKLKKPVYNYSLKNPDPDSPVRIAIMIDDVGVNRKLSKAVVDFKDVSLTLAFLPYAPKLSDLTEPAAENGHELMIHMPMEPMNDKIDTGPIALKTHMERAEVDAMLNRAFASFKGYKGINNHMGSRMTQDSKRMAWVMEALAERDLFYVDSKTISTSIAADKARDAGIDYAVRDVFLDHEDTPEFVAGALKRLERIALKQGHAIAIGHPKNVTINGLREWIPTLEARGFEIVPVSELLLSADAGVPAKVAAKSETKDDLPLVIPAAGDVSAEVFNGEAISGLYQLPSQPPQ